MNTIVKNMIIIRRYIVLSFKNLIEFPVDFIMNFIMILFDIGTILLFWISLFEIGILVDHWSKLELLVFIALNIFSEAISKITFGFRDLEFFVINGTFDKFLIRPLNPIFSLILEKLNIFTIISKIVLSIIMLIIAHALGNFEFNHILLAFLTLIIGTITFDLIYGLCSLSTFWIGKIYTARELIFSFKEAKNYPLDIFPQTFINIFTHTIPLAFLSTIPTKILLNKYSNSIYYLIEISIIFIFIILIFNLSLKKALLKYNSTGC